MKISHISVSQQIILKKFLLLKYFQFVKISKIKAHLHNSKKNSKN